MNRITGRAALGFRAHSGWAAMVAVAATDGDLVVLLRRRVALADSRIAGSSQLYHTAAGKSLADATAFVERCTAATAAMADYAIRAVISELSSRGHQPAGAGVLLASGRPPGDLATILASHPRIHTAEGEFYRQALLTACRGCGLAAAGIPERDLWNRTGAILGLSAEDLAHRISALGKIVGPPWRQDEKLSTLAAWVSMVERLPPVTQ